MTKITKKRRNAVQSPAGTPSAKAFPKPSSDWIFGLILAAGLILAYQQAWNGKPIWDDEGHLTSQELTPVSGLARIWFQPGATQQYYPFVHSVFWVEYHLWGYSTTGYHLLNILLHLFSALMLVKILRRLQVPGGWLAAALFALHPVEVESVAWISELKNTLSGAFFLSAAFIYLKFDKERRPRDYLMAVLLFFLGLMSKSVIVSLPFVLLIVFWWKRGTINLRRDVLPLVPFMIVGIACGLFTSHVERKFIIGGEGAEFNFPLVERFLIAGRAFWFYLWKIFWPAHLVFIYPRWDFSRFLWWQFLFPAAGLLFFGILLANYRRRALLATFLYFSVVIFPALGFFTVYPFRFSFVADHFQYLAGLGPMVLAAAGLTAAAKSIPKFQRSLLACILPSVLAFLTWRQCAIYRDADTIYYATLKDNPTCWMAHYNLGNSTLHQGRIAEAIEHYRKTIAYKPDYLLAHISLGNTLVQVGKIDEGIQEFRRAAEIDSTSTAALVDLGNTLMMKNRVDEAIIWYQRAVRIDPRFAVGRCNLGNALFAQERIPESIEQFRACLELDPHYIGAMVSLGKALAKLGRMDESAQSFARALQINPDLVEANAEYGAALLKSGNPAEAARYLQRAVRHGAADIGTVLRYHDALVLTGQFEKAISIDRQVLPAAKHFGRSDLQVRIEKDLEKLQRRIVNRLAE